MSHQSSKSTHVYDETSVPLFSNHEVREARTWADESLRRYCPQPDAVSLERRIGTPAAQVTDVAIETRADFSRSGWSQDLSGRVTGT
jgi:hypothetical protein